METFAERHPVAFLLTVIFTVVLVIAALSAFIWGLKTDFSYWWGQQGAIQEKNSTQNWTQAQVSFHQQVNDVDGFKQKIILTRQQLADFDKAHPHLGAEDGLVGMQDTQTRNSLATDLTGLQQQCLNTVAAYNTASEGYLTADWKDADLPSRLDPSVCN